MSPLYVLGRRQAGSRRVPVAALQLHACWNWADCLLGTGSLQHATLQGSGFQGPIRGSSVLPTRSPPVEAPVCQGPQLSHSAACIPLPLLVRGGGEGGKEEKLVIAASRLSPPKMLLPKGCPSVRVPLPSVRSGNHTDAGETGLSGSSYLWRVREKCQAVSKALSRLFYLWITRPPPQIYGFMQEKLTLMRPLLI